MKRRNDPSKIFYIPAWQTGVVERKLAEYARCGYKPMDFQELPCSIWRITFRKSEPHSTDYLTGVRKTGLDRNYEMSICQAGLDNEKPLYSVKT